MGNCGASQRAVESWADDGEWEEETSSEEGDHHHERTKEHVSEVTMRITRRQLQELMEKKNDGHGRGSGPATEQLLADIMNSGEVRHHDHHGDAHWHWKPALQSIPEVVES